MSGELTYFVGPDPLPALGSGLPAIVADSCGMEGQAGRLTVFAGPARSGRSLLGQELVGELLARTAAGAVLWTGSAESERRLAQLGVVPANSPARVARRLENKAHFQELAAAAGLPVPAAVAGPAGPELAARALGLGLPLVFQLARGYSGAGTHPVAGRRRLEELCREFRGHPARISRLVPGTPVTATGVALDSEVVLGPPCLQLTGMELLTPHPMGSCGNDVFAEIPEEALVRDAARRVGELLRARGHRGIFGVDLVVEGGGPAWCIEVNPRLVASVPLWSLSARGGGPSLVRLHLAAFGLGREPAAAPSCRWSQLVLYRQREAAGHPGLGSCEGRVEADGEFVAGRPLPLEGPAEGAAALVVRPPGGRGRELARLLVGEPLTGPEGGLRPRLERCASLLRDRLEPEAPAG